MSASSGYQVFCFAMNHRRSRRRLVVCVYLILTMIYIVTLAVSHLYSWTFGYALYAALAVSIFVFGGRGRHGLIKAFQNKPPKPEPPFVDVIRLHLNPMSVGTPNTSSWKNDERELSRGDAAHYIAYQALATAILPVLLLAAWAVHPPHWINPAIVLNLLLAFALGSSILSVTLPAAIILWTEPDIEPSSFN